MITAFYQYTDGSLHAAGIATINKETFVFPVRISGQKPVCKFIITKIKKQPDANTTGVI